MTSASLLRLPSAHVTGLSVNGNTAPRVLVADDDRGLRLQLVALLERLGYQVIEMADGSTALAWLRQHAATQPGAVDVLVIDREMPGLDGLSLARHVRQEPALANLPVVMITGADKPAQVQEGINAGVFYYLTKPINAAVLHAVVSSAVDEVRRRRALLARLELQRGSYTMLRQATFSLRTLADAERLAMFVAPCFPQPERVLTGLVELLVNAVEHGLLGIGYATKTTLLEQGRWLEEINRREAAHGADPLLAARHVGVLVERLPGTTTSPAQGRITINDPGPGFNWRSYLELVPDRATDNHGRGIAQARALSFDSIVYNASGNSVTATAGTATELQW